jgi:hypothetical protein
VNRPFFLSLSREFGDSDVSVSILKDFHTYYPLGQIYNHFGECSIPFLASEFHELKSSDLDSIPMSTLYDVLSHDRLKISSEDSLYWYLSSHFLSDPAYFDFLRFIQFEYLSPECISNFVLMIPECIDHHFWESLFPRLISRFGSGGTQFPLREAKSVDGIISYLTQKHGGNVHDKGIVTITSKSVRGDDVPRNVADLTSPSQFRSDHGFVQWICLDFHEIRVCPTHYTIKSASLKSWLVESSLDGEAWTKIDRKTNNNDFKASFAVSNSDECRFIRLTQTEQNRMWGYELGILAFELFGILFE